MIYYPPPPHSTKHVYKMATNRFCLNPFQLHFRQIWSNPSKLFFFFTLSATQIKGGKNMTKILQYNVSYTHSGCRALQRRQTDIVKKTKTKNFSLEDLIKFQEKIDIDFWAIAQLSLHHLRYICIYVEK